MTLKEEFEEMLISKFMYYYDAGMNMWTIIPSDDAKSVYSWIEQQIKQACDKQKEICAEEFMKVPLAETNVIRWLIKDAPSPKESE